jgi:hypothetical protein
MKSTTPIVIESIGEQGQRVEHGFHLARSQRHGRSD